MSNKPFFNEFGEELPDDTPIAKPVRFNRPGSTLDEIRRNIGLAQRLAEEQGAESFEEADDFEIGDDFDPSHPWAHQVDNLNQEYEKIRDQVRAARDRGEIELRPDGTWVPRQQGNPQGGMGAVRPHGDSAPTPAPVSPAPPASNAPTPSPAP